MGQQYLGYTRGLGLILDNTLNIVHCVQSQGSQLPLDMHEFNVVDNGASALISIYQPQQADLSADGIASGLGWILDCWFQDIDLRTNEVLFEWSALGHVSPSHSTVAPNSTQASGTGLDPTLPWDYFHINSVDKNAAGDYLISARHTSTIYKISGRNGTILWQLGGQPNFTASSFTLTGGLNFSYQHNARFVYENATTTILSLFDNAADGVHLQSANYSSGLLIAINQKAATAHLLQSYPSPDLAVSSSQGGVQILHPANWETSNVYCGWGMNAYISEHTHNGTLLQQGHFATTAAMAYRSRKANFTIHPTDAPSLYAYALNANSSTQFYMSWNGATEIRGWRIYTATGSSSQNPKFKELASFPKSGFETIYTAKDYHQWAIVEALCADGNGIKNSSRVVETFMPGQQLAAVCDEEGCPSATAYSGSGPTIASVQYPAAAKPASADAVVRRALGSRGARGAPAPGSLGGRDKTCG